MSARTLLRELRERGAKVRVVGGDLCIRPKRVVPPALVERLREHKPALVRYLRDRPSYPCATCGNFRFGREGVVCWWCRSREDYPRA